MGHKIIEAIIEDGQLKHVNKKLPAGRIKVHLIYDTVEETYQETKIIKIIKRTSGIYKDKNIDIEAESKKLRGSWERNVRD